MLYAAAIGGEDGVRHALTLLHAEVDRDMAMLGYNTVAEVTRDCLMDARGFDGLF
jgi:L-lactate dehydrogenase (cytochrome)